jgi:ubiquinone/menaquinone biosynthesis C-methylase UbiE
LSQSLPSAHPYTEIAALYDLEHNRFRDDLDLIHYIVETVGDPVLELGCGTGRVLAHLADLEMRLTGIDNSPSMLERARARLDGVADVRLVESEMSTTGLPDETFGVVLLALNTLMHASTLDEQRRVLAEAFRVLDPRGQLFIDLPNPLSGAIDFVDHQVVLEGNWDNEPAGRPVSKFSSRVIQRAEQVIQTNVWYDISGEVGQLGRIHTRFDLRYVYPVELLLMLELAGFVEPKLYGTYELDPFSDSSPRLIATAEKTHSS